MKKLGVVLGAWVGLMMSALDGTAQTPAPVDPDGPMPVAEFNAAVPADPAEAAIRAARNQRFSLAQGHPITMDDWGWSYSFHPRVRSEKDLVEEADAIVEGSVETAAAYISENRHIVYSEFRVRVDGALKDRGLSRAHVLLAPGDVLAVLREGGAVQLPDGRVVKQIWNSQRVPLVGQRYMLFLRREPLIQGFTLLTAYELKESEVSSLDEVYYFPLLRSAPLAGFRQRIRELIDLTGS